MAAELDNHKDRFGVIRAYIGINKSNRAVYSDIIGFIDNPGIGAYGKIELETDIRSRRSPPLFKAILFLHINSRLDRFIVFLDRTDKDRCYNLLRVELGWY